MLYKIPLDILQNILSIQRSILFISFRYFPPIFNEAFVRRFLRLYNEGLSQFRGQLFFRFDESDFRRHDEIFRCWQKKKPNSHEIGDSALFQSGECADLIRPTERVSRRKHEGTIISLRCRELIMRTLRCSPLSDNVETRIISLFFFIYIFPSAAITAGRCFLWL